jgi:hypothetical protein
MMSPCWLLQFYWFLKPREDEGLLKNKRKKRKRTERTHGQKKRALGPPRLRSASP